MNILLIIVFIVILLKYTSHENFNICDIRHTPENCKDMTCSISGINAKWICLDKK